MDARQAAHGPQQPKPDAEEAVERQALAHFSKMVESVGIKRFAQGVGLSTRQINRILTGAQPNPVHRLIRCVQSSTAEDGDLALDFICKEAGGHFVRDEGELDAAASNAVKECAEAIAALSDGKICPIDEQEIREAIAALVALSRLIREHRRDGHDGEIEIPIRGS